MIMFYYYFSKTTAPQQLIFEGTLSTIIIFKRCKFNVNLWTLCLCLQKVPKSFKTNLYVLMAYCV